MGIEFDKDLVIEGIRYYSKKVMDRRVEVDGVPLGKSEPVIKTIPQYDPDKEITVKFLKKYRDLDLYRLSESVCLDSDYAQQVNIPGMTVFSSLSQEEKDRVQLDLEIGDRMLWNIKLANYLALREDPIRADEKTKERTSGGATVEVKDKLTDRQEARLRYKKMIWLFERTHARSAGGGYSTTVLSQAQRVVTEKGATLLNMNETFGQTDIYAYTEFRDGRYVWKEPPLALVGQAMTGLASMILDDVGKGMSPDELQRIYGFSSKDAALNYAINTCVMARECMAATTDIKDHYTVGLSFITEAKCRMLRRGGSRAGDTNEQIQDMLREYISRYNLDAIRQDRYIQYLGKVAMPGKSVGDSWALVYDSTGKKTIQGVTSLNDERVAQYVKSGATVLIYRVVGETTNNLRIEVKGSMRVAEWIKLNKPTLEKYPMEDTELREQVPLAQLGVYCLVQSAKLEIEKLNIESDDSSVVYRSAINCYGVQKALESPESVIPGLAECNSDGAVKLRNKKSDYMYFDSLAAQADLLSLFGSMVRSDQTVTFTNASGEQQTSVNGDAALARAYGIYRKIDDEPDNNDGVLTGVCPYQDIRARAIDGRTSIALIRENFDFAKVEEYLTKYYSVTNGEATLTTPFFKESFMYFKVRLAWAKFLVSRNQTRDSYRALNRDFKWIEAPGSGLPPLAFGGENDVEEMTADKKTMLMVKTKDASLARHVALEIINNIGRVKAQNQKGKKDLKERAKLILVLADYGLSAYEPNDTSKARMVNANLTAIEDIIIGLAGNDYPDADRAAKLSRFFQNLLGNQGIRYKEMDYAFFVELYSTWASLLEQKAWLDTKLDRERLTTADVTGRSPLYNRILSQFQRSKDMMAQVNRLIDENRNVKSTYDRLIRPVTNSMQRTSLSSFQINVDRALGSTADAESVLASLEMKVYQADFQISTDPEVVVPLYNNPVAGIRIVDLIEMLKTPSMFPIDSDGIPKLNIGIEAPDGKKINVKIPKKLIEDAVAYAYRVEIELRAKQIYLVGNQTCYDINTQKAKIEAYYKAMTAPLGTQAAPLPSRADYVLSRASDPFYVLENLLGASVVYMSVQPDYAASMIRYFFSQYIFRGDRSVRVSYKMCEAGAIAASRLGDKEFANQIINSLNGVIDTLEGQLALIPASDTRLRAETNDILSQSCLWRANLKSWFYEDTNESGDMKVLEAAKADYTKALGYNRNNLSAKAELASINLRMANIKYRQAVRKADINSTNFSGQVSELYTAYLAATKEYLAILSVDVSTITMSDLGNITENVKRMRRAQYIASQVKVCQMAVTLQAQVIYMMANNPKLRITALNDSFTVGRRSFIETRVSQGDIVSQAQLDSFNNARLTQNIDGIAVFPGGQPRNMNGRVIPTALGTNAADASFTDAQVNGDKKTEGLIPLLLSRNWNQEAINRQALLSNVEGIYRLSPSQQLDYQVDRSEVLMNGILRKIYIAVSKPTQENITDAVNALEALYRGAYANPFDKLKIVIWYADFTSWIAMSSEQIDHVIGQPMAPCINQAVALYDEAIDIYEQLGMQPNPQLLLNRAEAVAMTFYKNRTSNTVTDALNAFLRAGNVNDSNACAKADVKAASLYNASASYGDKVVKYNRAREMALRALKRILGVVPVTDDEKADPARFYIKYIYNNKSFQKDKMVIEALCYLVTAEAWLYDNTLSTAQKRDAATITTLWKKLDLLRKVLDNAEYNYASDKKLRQLVVIDSDISIPYVMIQVNNMYLQAGGNDAGLINKLGMHPRVR